MIYLFYENIQLTGTHVTRHSLRQSLQVECLHDLSKVCSNFNLCTDFRYLIYAFCDNIIFIHHKGRTKWKNEKLWSEKYI